MRVQSFFPWSFELDAVPAKLFVKLGLAVLAFSLASGKGTAQQAILTDDAQVSSTAPNTPTGANQILRVAPGTQRVFLRFSLGSSLSLLPPGTVGAHVGAATLKVFVNGVAVNGQLGVAQVQGPWSEATLTNANAPALGSFVGFFNNITPASQNHWLSLDVTQLVRQWIDNPGSNNGVALFSAPGGADLTFDAKEDIAVPALGTGILSGHAAQLDIVLNHAANADNAVNALNAANATQLGGKPANNYVLVNDPLLAAPRPPAAGSPNYIQNTTVQQPLASFNVSGDGTVGGTLRSPSANIGLDSAPDSRVKLHVRGGGGFITGMTEVKIQSNDERAILSLDSTIGGKHYDYTLENGVFFNPGLFAIFDRNAFLPRLTIDPAGKVNILGNLDVGDATAPEATPENHVKFRVHGAPPPTDNDAGIVEAKIQSDTDRAILSLDSTFAGQRRVYTLENGLFGNPGLFAIFDRTLLTPRLLIDTTGKVTVPGNLDVQQTLSANALSLNIVNAAQYNLGGNRFITADPARASTYVGQKAGVTDYGLFNSFFGTAAGAANTSGVGNSFFGDTAGLSNTSGGENSSFGSGAGAYNLTGDENSLFGYHSGLNNTACCNSFFGSKSGESNTSGLENSFFGYQAGLNNVNGLFNSYFGAQAGYNNTEGQQNAFFGWQAGLRNSKGGFNAFFGAQSGQQNQTGQENAFFGYGAGTLNDAKGNSFFGSGSGVFNTSGTDNTFVGHITGPANRTGSSNTLLGANANVGLDGITNATAIGAGAVVSQSSSLILGNNANVGIGTSTPASKLTVAGLIETTAEGLKFPDHSVQNKAAFGTITGVVAGKGLSGGGNFGDVTLAVPNLGITTPLLADFAVIGQKIAAGQVVRNINGLTDNLALVAGPNVTITPAGNTLTISASASASAAAGIFNQTVKQAGANFNIDGTGTADTLNAVTQFSLDGLPFISTSFEATNTFVGGSVGSRIGGAFNSFFGSSAGAFITPDSRGFGNTFLGANSGARNQNGSGNVFVGHGAGQPNTSGDHNSFVGQNAGKANTTGIENVFIGGETGRTNVGGDNNTLLGFLSDVGMDGLTNATAIGAGAIVSQSNSVVLGNGANVGIGISDPSMKLQVDGGNIYVSSPGQGIMLTSPNGTCFLLTVNDLGALGTTPCP